MGDQFIALSARRTQPPDGARHLGLVVDDKEAVRAALQQESVAVQPSGSLDFVDPWGNHVQVVDYREIQFIKTPGVLSAMGLDHLRKTEWRSESAAPRGSTPSPLRVQQLAQVPEEPPTWP